MRQTLFRQAFATTRDVAAVENPAHCLVRNLIAVLEHTERLPVVMHERCVLFWWAERQILLSTRPPTSLAPAPARVTACRC